MRLIHSLPLIALLTLVGCAPAKVWIRPDYTPQNFAHDSSRCQSMAGFGGGSASIGQSIAQQNLYNTCMVGEGWSLVDRQ